MSGGAVGPRYRPAGTRDRVDPPPGRCPRPGARGATRWDNRPVPASAPYLKGLRLVPERVPGYEAYPFSIPFVRGLDLTFDAPVTILVGENGTGKSTLLEALASAIGVPAGGGGRNELADVASDVGARELSKALRPSFARRPPD